MKKIILNDRIYRTAVITEPVLIELLKSNPIQRLKKINQYGVPDKYYHLKNYSRYEHSIGVMLLLRKLGAREEEQVAGLIHDVSHTAFSHVYDWVIGSGGEEDAQDRLHKDFVDKSLGKILKKYKLTAKKIADYKKFTLLEQDMPHLCADRIDYFLRELDSSTARKYFNNLSVANNKVIFKNKIYAKKFAKEFLRRQVKHWGGLEAVSRYEIFSTILKICLQEKIIKEEDFWLTDPDLMKKIYKSKNQEIKRLLKLLENKSLSKFSKNKEVKYKKFRYVDPLYLKQNKLVRLSQEDIDFKKILLMAKGENKKGINPIKFQ